MHKAEIAAAFFLLCSCCCCLFATAPLLDLRFASLVVVCVVRSSRPLLAGRRRLAPLTARALAHMLSHSQPHISGRSPPPVLHAYGRFSARTLRSGRRPTVSEAAAAAAAAATAAVVTCQSVPSPRDEQPPPPPSSTCPEARRSKQASKQASERAGGRAVGQASEQATSVGESERKKRTHVAAARSLE